MCKEVENSQKANSTQSLPHAPSPEPAPAPAAPAPKDGDILIKSGQFNEFDTKILLIGPGESGKTTIWRQLKVNYCGGFDKTEKATLKPCIQINILSDMANLISYMHEHGNSVSEDLLNSADVITSLNVTDSEELCPDVAAEIKKLWNDPMMKLNYSNATNIGIGDNADFFIESVERIASPSYVPSDEDLLKSRIKTTGKSDLDVMFNDIRVKMVDIGGQLSERKNWDKFYKGVEYLIFVIPLSDFNQQMYEESSMLRTNDTRELFEKTANEIFGSTPIFLVFNKLDMFERKLREFPDMFRKAYPGFEGDTNNTSECVEFVRKEFLSKLNPDREPAAAVQTITISAMETSDIQKLFQTVAKKVVEDKNSNNTI